jgi:hypothetical protein
MTTSVGTVEGEFTATISVGGEVTFVAATDSAPALAARIIDYVRERCDYVLWPREAAAVHASIEAGRLEEAIGLYFSSVGQRWDVERLELGRRQLSPSHLHRHFSHNR